MENRLRIDYYKNAFIRLNCAYVYGRKILAKPIFVLSIIDSIEQGFLAENKIEWKKGVFEKFHDLYNEIFSTYLHNEYPTPIYKPFFHLAHDGFWHHNVKHSIPPPKAATIRYLSEELNYAYLDQALWDLLQDFNVREEFRETIINFFLKTKEE